MDTIRAWKDPEYRKTAGADAMAGHPSGVVSLDDDSLDEVAGATAVVCVITSAVSAMTATVCSPTGTLCGSCSMGTSGCC